MSETENANVNMPKYRTERLAEEAYEDLREVPEKLFLLSHKDYQSSFDYQVTDGENSPHMRMLKEGLDIQFENGQLTIGGNPASKVDLIDMYTKKDITNLDTVMLRNLFSIIWFNLRDDIDEVAPVATKQDENDFYDHMSPHEKHRSQIEKWIDFDRWWRRNLYGYTIRIYVPKFMAYLGYDANYSQAMVDAEVEKIKQFNSVIGIMNVPLGNKVFPDDLPVMMFSGYERSTNTIMFFSPYMNRVVEDALRNTTQVWKDRRGKAKLKSNGEMIYLPPVTTSVDSAIASAKNKRAAELVIQLAILFAGAGDMDPNIRVDTLIDRCPNLRESLFMAENWDTKNKMLRRSFMTMWDYIDKYTNFAEEYELPRVVPTMKTYKKMKFVFKHKKQKATP